MLGNIKKIQPLSATLSKTVQVVTKIIEVEGRGDHQTIELSAGYYIKKINSRIIPLFYETIENQG